MRVDLNVSVERAVRAVQETRRAEAAWGRAAAEESSEAKCSSARTSATSVGGELVLGRASAASTT